MPALDCSFRDLLAAYYQPHTDSLMHLLAGSRQDAHPAEPHFEPFENPLDYVPCSVDARKDLDLILALKKKSENKSPNCH